VRHTIDTRCRAHEEEKAAHDADRRMTKRLLARGKSPLDGAILAEAGGTMTARTEAGAGAVAPRPLARRHSGGGSGT
jgi:hypothetical protein